MWNFYLLVCKNQANFYTQASAQSVVERGGLQVMLFLLIHNMFLIIK